MEVRSRPRERDHPRVPPDMGAFVTRVAAELRSAMIDQHGDGRIIGWGTAARLLMVHAGLMRPEGTELEFARLTCLPGVLARTKPPRPEVIA